MSFLFIFGINTCTNFSKTINCTCTCTTDSYNFVSFWKIKAWLFIPDCTGNHVICTNLYMNFAFLSLIQLRSYNLRCGSILPLVQFGIDSFVSMTNIIIYYCVLEQRKLSNCAKGQIEPQHIFLDNESVKAVIDPFFGVSLKRRPLKQRPLKRRPKDPKTPKTLKWRPPSFNVLRHFYP